MDESKGFFVWQLNAPRRKRQYCKGLMIYFLSMVCNDWVTKWKLTASQMYLLVKDTCYKHFRSKFHVTITKSSALQLFTTIFSEIEIGCFVGDVLKVCQFTVSGLHYWPDPRHNKRRPSLIRQGNEQLLQLKRIKCRIHWRRLRIQS